MFQITKKVFLFKEKSSLWIYQQEHTLNISEKIGISVYFRCMYVDSFFHCIVFL